MVYIFWPEVQVVYIFWPEVQVVYIFGFKILNFAKLASNWLEKNLRAVSYGRIHVTNFKTLDRKSVV